VAPGLTYVEAGVTIGKGTVVEPFSVIRTGVRIAAFSRVGPFAHVRSGTRIERGAEVGNFVEVKASRLGARARALHLSYLGDAEVGPAANVGAGTITANFDGKAKHRTKIGPGAFVGSGTVLVAPVNVGAKARTGAGAVVLARSDVPAGATAVGVPARVVGSRKRSVRTSEKSHGNQESPHRGAKVHRKRGVAQGAARRQGARDRLRPRP
jgi:bifunctional UDP-N-acetylglucosamine pyrophosphorylase/glucosamine-1-phosphate N-acetyltransferase